jgi:hypothetical protein
MLKNSRFILTTAMMGLLGAAVAMATPVTIVNFSFEDDVLVDGTFTTTTISGWTCTTGSCGVYNPPFAAFSSQPNLPAPADLVNAAYSNSGTIAQILSSTVLPNTLYTLRVAVGNRKDTPFPGYQVQLLGGATILAQDNSILAVPDDAFQDSVITFLTGGSGGTIGQALQVRLISNGVQTMFDNVRLDASPSAIPEPGTVSMMLIGLGAVVAGIRRKIRA